MESSIDNKRYSCTTGYTLTTTKSFDEAVQSLQEEIAKAGMRVLVIHDVQKTLAEKGFQREPFKISYLVWETNN